MSARSKRRASTRRASKHRPALRKHHLTALVVIIPTLFFLFLIPLLLQQQRLGALNDAYKALSEQYEELSQREAFYREAYEVALGDLRILSTAYGGDDRYVVLAKALREQEQSFFGNVTDEQVYTVRNPAIWQEYIDQGIVQTDCIASTVVNATSDEALFSLHILEGSAGLYLDGNYLRELGPGAHGLTLRVAPGEHEVSLVSSSGLRYDALSLEGEPVLPVPRYDRGTTWQIFDCLDVSASSEGPGALRIPFTLV
ncbi:hypothetical protein D6789_01290 [Candidatus Woesearchaeota archaeon]|nr:MAG: hypothetical protein D6789_01290 [Candidatus Woesearchaeota archaeon]